MLFDRDGRPWPIEPEQFKFRIAHNANQVNHRVGVFPESTLVSLTPQQTGVLLGLLPMSKNIPLYCAKIVRRIMVKILSMCTDRNIAEEERNKWCTIKTFAPLLCTQISNKVSKDAHILKLKNILSRIQQHHIDSFLVGELNFNFQHDDER